MRQALLGNEAGLKVKWSRNWLPSAVKRGRLLRAKEAKSRAFQTINLIL